MSGFRNHTKGYIIIIGIWPLYNINNHKDENIAKNWNLRFHVVLPPLFGVKVAATVHTGVESRRAASQGDRGITGWMIKPDNKN